MICYRCGTNPSYLNTVLCLLFVGYLLAIASPILPLPAIQKTYTQFMEMQKPADHHMQTEFLYFYLLGRLCIFYFGIHLSVGGNALSSVLGSDLHLLLSYYMCASLAVCTVVRLIAVVAFNPLSDKTVKF
jgi:hypothetical protein